MVSAPGTWIVVAVVAALLCAAPVAADPSGSADVAAADEEFTPGWIPALTALVPGFAVSGAGHFVAGERDVARKLAVAQAAGLGAFLLGGVPIALSGASEKAVVPGTPLVVGGMGVFVLSWLADIYGASGGGLLKSEPWPSDRTFAGEVGYAYVADPQFSYGSFLVGSLRLSWPHYWLEPSAYVAIDDDNQRFRVAAARRTLGRVLGGEQSFIEILAAITTHRYGREHFASHIGEAQVRGQLDLGLIGASLDGSFAGLSAGLATEWTRYELGPGRGDGVNDYSVFPLLGFDFGMAIGAGPVRGELSVGYEHRRDFFVGGQWVPQQGSGFLGYFKGEGRVLLPGEWMVGGALWQGSARMVQLTVGRRLGAGQ